MARGRDREAHSASLPARAGCGVRREGRGQGAPGEGTTEKVASELLAKGLPILMVLFITFFLLLFFPVKARGERNCESKLLMRAAVTGPLT